MTDDGAGELLKDACDQVIYDPDLAPHDGKTFCNIGCLFVANALGCEEFNKDGDPYTADEMIAIMEANASGRWTTGSGSEAAIHALGGGLAIAAKSSADLGEAHGHVAVVYPASQQWSGSWKKDTVLVANVGRRNGEEKASEAFPVIHGEPTFYLWTKEA